MNNLEDIIKAQGDEIKELKERLDGLEYIINDVDFFKDDNY